MAVPVTSFRTRQTDRGIGRSATGPPGGKHRRERAYPALAYLGKVGSFLRSDRPKCVHPCFSRNETLFNNPDRSLRQLRMRLSIGTTFADLLSRPVSLPQ